MRSNPKFLIFSLVVIVLANQGHVLDGYCRAVLAANEVESNHEVVNILKGIKLKFNELAIVVCLAFCRSRYFKVIVCQFQRVCLVVSIVVAKLHNKMLDRLVG